MDQFDLKDYILQTEALNKEIIDSNIFALNAKMCKKQYDALKEEGFTHDEAIVLSCALSSKK
jgi:hypothetical protein